MHNVVYFTVGTLGHEQPDGDTGLSVDNNIMSHFNFTKFGSVSCAFPTSKTNTRQKKPNLKFINFYKPINTKLCICT